jgi:flagellar basal-body rod protein FlgF
MDNTLLVTLSAQNALRRQMDVAANNMANVSTAGFKSEEVLFEPETVRPASIAERPGPVNFVRDYTTVRDSRPGALQRTGNPLDLALASDGFFTVGTPQGPAFTRDGQFKLDAAGQLITQNGQPVLDTGGAPITLDLAAGEPLVGKTGIITQDGAEVAQLGIATFQRPGALDKVGDNLLRPTIEQPAPLAEPDIVQGMVEGSNVVAVRELTRIIEINRAYESISRLQRQAEDLRKSSIERLARVQS